MSAKRSDPWPNVDPYEPCPCGSGRKYKFCCRARLAAEREKPFIAELRPDIDKEVAEVLQKLEAGAGSAVQSRLQRMLASHPNYHMTNYAMGVYLAAVANDPGAALPFFEKAVEVFPPFPEAHFNLGNAARQAMNIPKAVAGYRNAQRYSSSDDGIAEMARNELRFLEDALLKNTRLKTLDACLANEQLFDNAFECMVQGQFEHAIEMFKRVLDGIPNHVQSYGNMALAYAGLGRKAAAMECLNKALVLDPSYAPAQLNRQRISEMKEGEPLVANKMMRYGIIRKEFARERYERAAETKAAKAGFGHLLAPAEVLRELRKSQGLSDNS